MRGRPPHSFTESLCSNVKLHVLHTECMNGSVCSSGTYERTENRTPRKIESSKFVDLNKFHCLRVFVDAAAVAAVAPAPAVGEGSCAPSYCVANLPVSRELLCSSCILYSGQSISLSLSTMYVFVSLVPCARHGACDMMPTYFLRNAMAVASTEFRYDIVSCRATSNFPERVPTGVNVRESTSFECDPLLRLRSSR